MNLKEIKSLLELAEPITEQWLNKTILDYCFANEITIATFSTVGIKGFGNTLKEFGTEFIPEQEFDVKKVTKQQSNEKLSSIIQKSYLDGQKDIVVFYRTFWGLHRVVFYDSETNSHLVIHGQASEQQEAFNKLVDLYHNNK
jgi:hypothetical protein